MSELRVSVTHETLSDVSKVFNVVLSNPSEAQTIIFHAVTELDAHDLADKIIAALHAHCVDKVWH